MSQRATRARAPVSYEEPPSEDDADSQSDRASLRKGSQRRDDSASPAKRAAPKAKKAKEPKKRAAPVVEEGGWVTKISKTTKTPTAPTRRRTKGSQSQSQAEETETQRMAASQRETEEPEVPVNPPPRKRGKGAAVHSKIYAQILQEGTAVKLIVTEFLKSYRLQRENPEKALCELTNFLIQSSGSEMLVSLSDHSSMDRDDLLTQIQKGTNESEFGDAYPIVSKQKIFKKFKSRFVEFFKKLVQALHKDPDTLYDGRLLPSLTEWLSVLSGSGLRSFRHTCTLATCELVSALVVLGKEEQGLKDKAERAASGRGQGGGVSGAKIAQLNKDIEQYTDHIEAMGGILDVCFNNVFVHRYRDIDVTIRTLCLESLGHWMLGYPEYFLTDNYLKYAGWCLSDKAVPVRRAALEATLHVVQTGDEDYLSRMEGLLTRFKPRFVEMAEDVDIHVAARAIQLVTLLLKYTKIVGEDEAPKIPSYIWDADPSIRKAAVEFVFEDMFGVDPSEEKKDPTVRNEEDLIQFLNIYRTFCPHALLEHEDERETQEGAREGIECMVDGFWNYLPFLQEWDLIYARLTLSEKANRKQKHSSQVPDDNEQELLICILLACAKKATGADKKAALKGKLTKKDKDEIDQKSEVLSVFLVRYLPDLLSTFQADRGKVKALVELVRFIDLEQFVVQRKTQDFIDLMEGLQKIYLKQNEPSVLEAVAFTLRHLCKSDHKLQDKADEVVRELATKLAERFKHLTDDKNEQSEERKHTDLLATLTRIECLSRMMYLKHMSYDAHSDVVLQKHMLEGRHEVVDLLLRLCCQNIFYLRANLNSVKPGKKLITEISNHNANFLSHIQYIFSHEFDNSLKFTAFKLASDIFVVFSENLLKNTPLSGLAVSCPEDIKDLYVDYFQDIVTSGSAKPPDDEDEKAEWEEEQARIEEDREVACRAACKVVMHDYSQHKTLAATLLSFMLKYSKEVDEIIKIAISTLRTISPAVCFTAQLAALQLVYETREEDEDDKEALARETHVSELAKRFALTHTQFQAPAKKPSAPWVNFFQHALDWAMGSGTSRYGFLECAIGPFVVRASPYDVGALYRSWKALEAKAREMKDKILDEEGYGSQADTNWGKLEAFSTNLTKIASRKGVKGATDRRPLESKYNDDEDDNKSVASHATAKTDFSIRGEDELDYKHTEDISLRLSMSPIRAASTAKGRRKSSTSQQVSEAEEEEQETKSSSKGKRSKASGTPASQNGSTRGRHASEAEEEEQEAKSSSKGKRSKASGTPASQNGSTRGKRGRGSVNGSGEAESDYEALSQEQAGKPRSRRSRGG